MVPGGLPVNVWMLFQILINVVFLAGLIGAWIRLHRPAQDDPRLSRGLQLLQSKIAVLEDLSDRTDIQVQQLTTLLESKCKDIQEKILQADQQLNRIDQSLKKSLEVSEIFQDRIPHQEIIERQNTIKYVKAAKMANEGRSIEEIAQVVDLQMGELEFISKINRNQLMFAEESLPSWAQQPARVKESHSVEIPPLMEAAPQPSIANDIRNKDTANKDTANKIGKPMPPAVETETLVQNGKTLNIKPFEFKKINLNGNLS